MFLFMNRNVPMTSSRLESQVNYCNLGCESRKQKKYGSPQFRSSKDNRIKKGSFFYMSCNNGGEVFMLGKCILVNSHRCNRLIYARSVSTPGA